MMNDDHSNERHPEDGERVRQRNEFDHTVKVLETRVHRLEFLSHGRNFSPVELGFLLLAFCASLWGVAGIAELVWSDVIDRIVASPIKTTVLSLISATFFVAVAAVYHYARSAEIKGEEIAYRSDRLRAKIEAIQQSRNAR